MTTQETFLVTGGMGCIGAWTLAHLIKDGRNAVSFDISTQRQRLDLLLTPEEQRAITFVHGDLTNFSQVRETLETHNITHIIHLAALQIPFCKADPVMGARVNVIGTLNVFEATRRTGISHLAYASSVGIYGPPEEETGQNHAPSCIAAPKRPPTTLYGVYKIANEETARIYWQDHHVSSTALRPYIVYGPGRDQGLTSDPTKAILAAIVAKPFRINYGGVAQYHFVSDVASQFIEAALRPLDGAYGFDLGTAPHTMEEFVSIIRHIKPDAEITYAANVQLPFPICDGRKLKHHFPQIVQTPLREGIEKTISHFERCLADGQITDPSAML
jgi:nucleoside-diphosphate-sugar epimerase